MKTGFLILLFSIAVVVCYAQDESETPIVNCVPAAMVDSFKFTSLNDAKERLDLYGLQIKNSNGLGIVIGYGGKNTQSNEGRNIAYEIGQYLTTKFKFHEYYTISSRDGGHREEKSVELFIKYNSCGADPDASPSLSFDEVNYKEEKQFFDKSSIRKSNAELRDLLTDEVEPSFPPAARAVRASGKVIVLVQVDEKGQVIKAMAIDGHPLLRVAAENALKQSSFRILSIGEQPVKYGGKFEIDFAPLIDRITDNR